MIHRALYGSLERFIGILIEHYAGAFPFWLAPVQVRVIPVGEAHREAANELAGKLGDYRVEVDERDETVGKRIRDAEVEKIPVAIVFGDKESDESLAVRERGGGQSTKSLDELLIVPCYAVILASRVPALTFQASRLRGGSTEQVESSGPLLGSGLVVRKGRN